MQKGRFFYSPEYFCMLPLGHAFRLFQRDVTGVESPQDAVEHRLGGIPMLNDEKKPFPIFGGGGH